MNLYRKYLTTHCSSIDQHVAPRTRAADSSFFFLHRGCTRRLQKHFGGNALYILAQQPLPHCLGGRDAAAAAGQS